MGSRGSFVNVNTGEFSFKEGGKTYRSIGRLGNIKALVRDKGSVKAPEYSHSADRIYAIIQNGTLKHVAYYDENHRQVKSIDLLHPHKGVQPHKHENLNHNDGGIPITAEEAALVADIKRRFKVR